MTKTITLKTATEIARKVKSETAGRGLDSFEFALEWELSSIGLQMPAGLTWDGADLRRIDRIAKAIVTHAKASTRPTEAEIAAAAEEYWSQQDQA